eukprot:TRINITY_DN117868_c0_g1_i1.p1 TRINITY_DN117868_c0_g1~~TRINITY_DN117868_c0_g1_i1.p1  ORF type:complete len:214 (+),score=18.81 TRINITY_DN117868_c0_g1_i1:112-753(+)
MELKRRTVEIEEKTALLHRETVAMREDAQKTKKQIALLLEELRAYQEQDEDLFLLADLASMVCRECFPRRLRKKKPRTSQDCASARQLLEEPKVPSWPEVTTMLRAAIPFTIEEDEEVATTWKEIVQNPAAFYQQEVCAEASKLAGLDRHGLSASVLWKIEETRNSKAGIWDEGAGKHPVESMKRAKERTWQSIKSEQLARKLLNVLDTPKES